MVSRHTAESGEKLERGLSYLLPRSYAQKLIDHGLAELVIPARSPVNVTIAPTKTVTMATALKEMRAKNQKQISEKKDK